MPVHQVPLQDEFACESQGAGSIRGEIQDPETLPFVLAHDSGKGAGRGVIGEQKVAMVRSAEVVGAKKHPLEPELRPFPGQGHETPSSAIHVNEAQSTHSLPFMGGMGVMPGLEPGHGVKGRGRGYRRGRGGIASLQHLRQPAQMRGKTIVTHPHPLPVSYFLQKESYRWHCRDANTVCALDPIEQHFERNDPVARGATPETPLIQRGTS